MAKTTASRKAKGRRLQTRIAKALLERFPISESDVRSTPMGYNGEDIWLSEKAKYMFPYAVEAKNTERLQIWEALKQSEQNTRDGTPLLVFSRNNTADYCALKFDDFLDILEKLFILETELDLQKEASKCKK